MGKNKNTYLLYCVRDQTGNQERKRGLKTLLQPPFGLELELLLTVNDPLLPKYSCYFSKKSQQRSSEYPVGKKKKSTLTSNLHHTQKSIPDGLQS